MIDVEQRPLRAFEQDALAGPPLAVEQRPHRIHEGKHFRRDRRQLAAQRVGADLGLAEPAAKRIVVGKDALDLGLEARQILQIHDADGAAPDLVLIGRTDATLGGADLAVAGLRLTQ